MADGFRPFGQGLLCLPPRKGQATAAVCYQVLPKPLSSVQGTSSRKCCYSSTVSQALTPYTFKNVNCKHVTQFGYVEMLTDTHKVCSKCASVNGCSVQCIHCKRNKFFFNSQIMGYALDGSSPLSLPMSFDW